MKNDENQNSEKQNVYYMFHNRIAILPLRHPDTTFHDPERGKSAHNKKCGTSILK